MRYDTMTSWRHALATVMLGASLAACGSDPTGSSSEERAEAQPLVTRNASGAAFITNNLAYVWANQPTTANYSPATAYSHNGMGGSIQILRIATGHYQVNFNSPSGWGSGRYGFAVTPYGTSTQQCSMWWHGISGTQLQVRVSCSDVVSHLSSDSRFTLLVVGGGSLLPRHAFALANQPAIPTYTPAHRYNGGAGPVVVTNSGAGDYGVDLGTGNPAGATFLVSAQWSFGDFCKVGQWHSTKVNVRCFDLAGNPKNAGFWALQLERGRVGKRFGFAFADKSTSATYTPNLRFSYNSSGGAITARRTAVGRYLIEFAGLQKLAGRTENVQVTGWGSGPTQCKTVGWSNSSTGLQVGVECRRLTDGKLVDGRYNILVIE